MKFSTIFPAVAVFAVSILVFANCKKEVTADTYKYQSELLNLSQKVANYSNPELPNHMAAIRQDVNASVTDHGATLGRVLFYDTKMSLNNKVACASCHKQENAFADPVKFSKGFDGGLTLRNANSISNLSAQKVFFWDAREDNLTRMVLQPVKNHIEMGMDNFDALERKLTEVGYYDELFTNAFGDKKITRERMASALDQFLTSMVSGNAKFDKVEQGTWGGVDLSSLSDQERRGHDIFFGQAGCASCHNGFSPFDQFETQSWADIGLEVNYTDKGLGENQSGMEGMFKVPSLRNVTLSAPYMHDGRFATLEEVVTHYNENIQPSSNLDWRLQGGDSQPRRLNLSQNQKQDLIAFLGTFTDNQFLTDPKFSDPFKK
jgi:cytochrome c peroxidase